MLRIRTYNAIDPSGIRKFDDGEIGPNTSDPDGILVRSQPLSVDDFSTKTRAVARCGVGVNNLPVKELSDLGIAVFNAPGANANAVAELVISSLLLTSRNIVPALQFTSELEEPEEGLSSTIEGAKKRYRGTEVSGRTLGLVGLGAVGAKVANHALNLGMHVIGFDPFISVEGALRIPDGIKLVKTLNDVFEASSFVSLHFPLLSHTRGLINSTLLSKGHKLTLLNFARGEVVDQHAVLRALDTGALANYVTDFPTPELVERAREDARVILFPHLGASTQESEARSSEIASLRLREFLRKGDSNGALNLPNVRLASSLAWRLTVIAEAVQGEAVTAILKDDLGCHAIAQDAKNDLFYAIASFADKPNESDVERIAALEGVKRTTVINSVIG